MAKKIRIVGMISSGAAFLLCFLAGAWILFNVGFHDKDDAIWTGMGMYFIGKAFFVGPMLLMAALRYE